MNCKQTLQNCKTKSRKIGKTAKRMTIRALQHLVLLYIYLFIFIIIYYQKVSLTHPSFCCFSSAACYFMLLCVNCYAIIAALQCHGEVMGRSLTNVTELFLLLFERKQIETLWHYLTLTINVVKNYQQVLSSSTMLKIINKYYHHQQC